MHKGADDPKDTSPRHMFTGADNFNMDHLTTCVQMQMFQTGTPSPYLYKCNM